MGKSSTALNVFGGSMVVTSNPAKAKTIEQSKWFMMESAIVKTSEQALSNSSSPYVVGTQLAGTAIDFTLAKLGADAVAWAQRYDCYTIEEAEVTLTMCARLSDSAIMSAPVVAWSFEDRDSPQEVECNWSQVRSRQNLCRIVLRANSPSLVVAKIKPVPLFDGGVADSSPANVVPSSEKFIDSLAVRQRFNGIRVFTACPQADTQGQTYSYTIYLESRVKVTARSAL